MFIKSILHNIIKKYKKNICLIGYFLMLTRFSFGITIEENHINNDFIYYNHSDESNKIQSIIDKSNTYLTNNGTLAVTHYGENYDPELSSGMVMNAGNGIIILNLMDNIIINNNGIIKGMVKKYNNLPDSYIYNAGNGIHMMIGNISLLSNSGLIQGGIHVIEEAPYINASYAGNGVYSYFTENILNTGNIIGDSYMNRYSQEEYVIGSSTSYNTNGIQSDFYTTTNSGNIIGNLSITQNFSTINDFDSSISSTANGIFSFNMKELYNNGIISGYLALSNYTLADNYSGHFVYSGNGLYGSYNNVDIIKNNGIIKGKTLHYRENDNGEIIAMQSGNGVFAHYITELNNNGIISGNSNYEAVEHSSQWYGNGIAGSEISLINNSGVIKGNRNGIEIENIEILNNNGIIIGQNIIVSNEIKENNNNGIHIIIDDSGNITNILNSTNQNTSDNIINAKLSDDGIDSFITIDSVGKFFDKIINGAGISNGSLNVNESASLYLSDSIVNAYETALYMNKNAKVNAHNTIFNGGGINNDKDIIKIQSNSNLNLTGSSIVNGKIGINGNNSTISVGNFVQLNGNIISNGEFNIIYLGNSETNQLSKNNDFSGLNIFHNISNFQEIDIESNVTLYESSQINSGDIKIEKGKLIVRIDGTKRDDANRILGHALYSHVGKIDVIGNIPEEVPNADWGTIDKEYAKLIFKTNGLAQGAIIAMDGSDISEINDWNLGTTNIVNTARKEGSDIIIDIKKIDDIFTPPIVNPKPPVIIPEPPIIEPEPEEPNNIIDDLGPIYDSIVNSNQLPNLDPTTNIEDKTTEDAKKGLLSLLDQIYANNPYTFVGNASLESIRLYRKNILNNKVPDENQWITSGQVTHSKDKYNNTKRSYKYGIESFSDSYHKKLDTTSILATVEYGVNESSSLGIAMGGSHQKLLMSNDSSVKGDTYYVGIFGKKKINNLTLTTGVGYQYGNYDINRNIKNNYQSIMNYGDAKTHSFDIYLDSKYTFQFENGFIIEPNIRLSQTLINQRKVSEKNNSLAIDVDKKNYSVPQIDLGMNFSKSIPLKNSLVTTTLGVGYSKNLGPEKKELTGKMKDSTNFNFLGSNMNDDSFYINLKTEIENKNGISYNINAGIQQGKNKQNNVNIGIGIGYKF